MTVSVLKQMDVLATDPGPDDGLPVIQIDWIHKVNGPPACPGLFYCHVPRCQLGTSPRSRRNRVSSAIKNLFLPREGAILSTFSQSAIGRFNVTARVPDEKSSGSSMAFRSGAISDLAFFFAFAFALGFLFELLRLFFNRPSAVES